MDKKKSSDDKIEVIKDYIDYNNKRFAISPNDSKSTFMPFPDDYNLNYILSVQYVRKMLNGNIVSYKNNQYMPMKDNDKPLLLNVDTSITKLNCLDTVEHQHILRL
jgi:hypothetical protein